MWALSLLLTLVVVGQDSELAAVTARSEALAHEGRLADAVGTLRAALAGAASDDQTLGEALRVLASLEVRTAAYADAQQHGEDAAARLERAGRGALASEARNTAGMAAVYLGRYTAAVTLFEAAQGMSAAAGDWARHAEQLTNLGSAHYFLGQYDAASRHYEQAAAVATAHRTAPWAPRRRVLVETNRAALLQRLGRYRDALAVYQRLDDQASPLNADEHAQMRINEGALYRRLGDPYKALDAYADAEQSLAPGGRGPGALAALTNRGIVLALDLHRLSSARPVFADAERLAARTGNRREEALAVLYGAEVARRSGDLDDAGTQFSRAVTLLERLDAPDDQWKAWLGAGRVRGQRGDDAGARAALDRAIAIIETLREQLGVPSARVGFFQDKREAYDLRIAASVRAGDVREAFALMERSRARGWRDQMALPAAVAIDDVQQALGPGVVALVYWHSPEGAAVVRLTATTADVHALEVSPSTIADAITATADRRADAVEALTRLGTQLLPADLTAGAREIVIVPDGMLANVPFDALTIDGAPLVARAAVSLLPAATMLVQGTRRPAWLPPWTLTLTAFGDPVPGADDFGRLPATVAELAALDRALGGRHQLFTGPDNRKAALLTALKDRPGIVHLATHAVADPAVAERSRVLFSPASAGEPAESLYLREVYALPLSGTELAVLSACDTERGPLVVGEGVEGFGRALLAAGAASAVTTLWRVPDAATARLMAEFYASLQTGTGRADALAHAKRVLLADPATAHPRDWAAFVLTGERAPLPRAPRWQSLLGGTLAVAGVLLAMASLRARGRRQRPHGRTPVPPVRP